MKLLSFKPFVIRKSDLTLRPYTLPDFVWPPHTIVKATCDSHIQKCSCVEKHIPGIDCNCGIYSTLDIPVVKEFMSTIQSTEDEIYIMGVVQLLGKIIQTGKVLRSEKVFLWGLIGEIGTYGKWRFPYIKGLSPARSDEFRGNYHPALWKVEDLEEHLKYMTECWKNYDPKDRKKVPFWVDGSDWDDEDPEDEPGRKDDGSHFGLKIGDRVQYAGVSDHEMVKFPGLATIVYFAFDGTVVKRDDVEGLGTWWVHTWALKKVTDG
jgi:hypothetical protein